MRQAHISKDGRQGGKAACGTGGNGFSMPLEQWAKEPAEARCKRCETKPYAKRELSK